MKLPELKSIKTTVASALRDHSYRLSLLLTVLNVALTLLALYLLYSCE